MVGNARVRSTGHVTHEQVDVLVLASLRHRHDLVEVGALQHERAQSHEADAGARTASDDALHLAPLVELRTRKHSL